MKPSTLVTGNGCVSNQSESTEAEMVGSGATLRAVDSKLQVRNALLEVR